MLSSCSRLLPGLCRAVGFASILIICCYIAQMQRNGESADHEINITQSSKPSVNLSATELHRRPKAVIYYLTQGSRVLQLKSSLQSLYTNFNDKYDYPVIIFYEFGDVAFSEDTLLALTKYPVRFHRIWFQIPSYVNRSAIPVHGCLNYFTLGYRQMCRFHAIGVYELPVLHEYDYALRLDDDSLLLRPIGYDIFEYMQENKLQYGYITEMHDSAECVVGLWDAADAFVSSESIAPSPFYGEWPKNHVFYNNFEVSALSLWTSDAYQKFVSYVDRLGGFDFHRWGEAPIKTLAVTLFVPRNETHRFCDVGYKHQSFINP